MEVASHVVQVGQVAVEDPLDVPWEAIKSLPYDSPLGCTDPEVEERMKADEWGDE